MHQEGFVVEFSPEGKPTWVGNFQPGITDYNIVLPHSDGTSLIVVAGGQAYLINPEERRSLAIFGGSIDTALAVPSAGLLVMGNGIWLEAWDSSGLRWRSRRFAWDGMRDLRIENGKVKGEAWSAVDDREYPFAVDLTTGTVEGGSYDGPPDAFGDNTNQH
jgi:hypothetical protein